MAVSSVRTAIRNATADGRLTLQEAKKIATIANRTSGVSAGEAAEVKKVLDSDVRFERGAKAALQGVVKAASGGGGLAGEVQAQIKAKGLDFFTGLKDSNQDKLPAAVLKGMDKLGEILGENDSGTIMYSARELKLGNETVYVANDSDYMSRELIAVWDSKGHELARVQVTRNDDFELTLKWLKADGKPGETIGRTPSAADDRFPAGWIARASAELEERVGRGDDAGKDVAEKSLPPAVRHQYDFLKSIASDSTGVMTFEFEGKKAYILADYSSVTSWHAVGSNGRKLFDYTG